MRGCSSRGVCESFMFNSTTLQCRLYRRQGMLASTTTCAQGCVKTADMLAGRRPQHTPPTTSIAATPIRSVDATTARAGHAAITLVETAEDGSSGALMFGIIVAGMIVVGVVILIVGGVWSGRLGTTATLRPRRKANADLKTEAGLSQILTALPLFINMACKQNLDLRCVLISDPSTFGCWGQNTSPCAQGCDLS